MKALKTVFLSFFAFLTAGCDIDRPLEHEISDQSFWKTENDLIAATNYLYTFLPGLPNSEDNMSDDGYAIQPNEISSGLRTPPATDVNYSQPYQIIRAANNIIEKAPRALQNEVPDFTVNLYVGEALFFRAWAYFDLVRKYGDVPLVLSLIGENDPILTSEKTPRAQVMEAIYKDLDAAIPVLTSPSVRTGAQFGRVTNTAALALKARAALFEGTRRKFHGDGEANTHLTLAAEAAGAVISSGEHSLFDNYYNLFQPAGEGRENRENIFVKKYGESIANNIASFNAGSIVNGVNNITRSLADAYLMEDGLPIDKSPLYVAPMRHIDYFTKRDARMAQTIFKAGDPYNQSVLFSSHTLLYHVTGFVSRKFVNPPEIGNQSTGNQSFIDRPLIRYAEVLLTFAEALYELNESISNADLDQSINFLRRRAGLPPLTNEFVATHGLSMREEIRRERRVELAVEGFRYWDIIRWKTAEEVLPRPVMGSEYFAGDFVLGSPILTPDNQLIVQSAETRGFRADRDYLWPFPVSELALNPQLRQNPNW